MCVLHFFSTLFLSLSPSLSLCAAPFRVPKSVLLPSFSGFSFALDWYKTLTICRLEKTRAKQRHEKKETGEEEKE